MNTLAAILRRLRTMPKATLTKKLSRAADHPHIKPRPSEGSYYLPHELATEVQTSNKWRRASRGDYESGRAAGIWDSDSELQLADDKNDAANVVRLLKLLKNKGVQGVGPRRKS